MDRKVVTMIPDSVYRSKNERNPYSFINKKVFSGVVLYSNLDGSFRDVYVYGGDFCPIIDAEVINPNDLSYYKGFYFLSIIRNQDTKAGGDEDGGILDASICIAFQDDSIDDLSLGWYEENGDSIRDEGGIGGGSADGGCSGGGYSGDASFDDGSQLGESITGEYLFYGSDGGGGKRDGYILGESYDLIEDVQNYSVFLYSAGGGKVVGSGIYQEGTAIYCQAIPNSSHVFDRWVGDFFGQDESLFYVVESDISSTAYFRHLLESGPVRPCYDAEKKMYNPLINMIIAPTSKWTTNYIGSTFGYTRYNGTKQHKGLDLYAPEGTPVYAMCDGVISSRNFVTDQPNRDTQQWPDDYSGDKDAAGNRFTIETHINGEILYILYWHMMAGTPVAVNPRTGKTFKPGDKVYAGEIVGYTGRTGNAYNVHYKHLHLGVMNKKGYINPESFINGSIQWDDISKNSLTSTEIINIHCDE